MIRIGPTNRAVETQDIDIVEKPQGAGQRQNGAQHGSGRASLGSEESCTTPSATSANGR